MPDRTTMDRREGQLAAAPSTDTADAAVARRASVGLVFQDPDDQLFSPTVFDDVAFGPLQVGLPVPEVRQRVSSADLAADPRVRANEPVGPTPVRALAVPLVSGAGAALIPCRRP